MENGTNQELNQLFYDHIPPDLKALYSSISRADLPEFFESLSDILKRKVMEEQAEEKKLRKIKVEEADYVSQIGLVRKQMNILEGKMRQFQNDDVNKYADMLSGIDGDLLQ